MFQTDYVNVEFMFHCLNYVLSLLTPRYGIDRLILIDADKNIWS